MSRSTLKEVTLSKYGSSKQHKKCEYNCSFYNFHGFQVVNYIAKL